MDLGSLELQIFVSLTVVLGGALVALICDYLKGNNEQLREHNIELRVRREEQERRMLLETAVYGNQVEPRRTDAAGAAKLDAEEVFENAEPHSVSHRRAGQSRVGRRGRNGRANGESFTDWVRPEVMARVARKAELNAACSQDIRDEVEAPRQEPQLQPLNAADRWDIRDQLPGRGKTGKSDRTAAPEPAAETPKQVEKIEQAVQGTMRTTGLIPRPQTVPALELEEEIQREAEAEPAAIPVSWSSPLLEEVIAASAARVTERPVVAVAGASLKANAEIAARENTAVKTAVLEELANGGETEIEPPVTQVRPREAQERMAAMEPVALPEPLPAVERTVEMPVVSPDALLGPLPTVEAGAAPWQAVERTGTLLEPLPEMEVEEPGVRPLDLPALVELDEIHLEPAPVTEPIKVNVIHPETEAATELAAERIADMILPAGMQDLATWNRLLEQPEPISGYVVMVKVEATENPDAAEAASVPKRVENLMRSLLRDGDFGCQTSDFEWVFIYPHDTMGLNQRRVGLVPEKLWDFKLRNINLTHLTFRWGAVDVKSEPLPASIEAARSRLYATRRNRTLPGAYGVGPQRVVNG